MASGFDLGKILKEKDPNAKLVKFYNLDEKKIELESKSTLMDIADFIGNLSRPFHTITAGAKRAIEGAKDPEEPLGTTLKETTKAAGRGWKREDRSGWGDVARALAPEFIDKIAQGTSLRHFGIKSDLNATSVVFFAADMIGDPVNLIPLGAPVKAGRYLFKGVADTAIKIAPAGAVKAVEKIWEKTATKWVDKVSPMFNLKQVFKNRLGQEGDVIFEGLKTGRERALYGSVQTQLKAATLEEKQGLFEVMRKYMTEEESNKLGRFLSDYNDLMDEAFGTSYHSELVTEILGKFGKSPYQHTPVRFHKPINKPIPIDTSKPVGGVFFHGTKAEVRSASLLDPVTHGDPQGLYGPGLYLTDNMSVASGYARTKGVGETGKILAAKVNNANLINLDKSLPDSAVSVFKKFVDSPVVDGPKNGKAWMSAFKNKLHGETTSDALEAYQNLYGELKKAGYEGFAHSGGGIVGKSGPKHNVVILFPDEFYSKDGVAGHFGRLLSEIITPASRPLINANKVLSSNKVGRFVPGASVRSDREISEGVAKELAARLIDDRPITSLVKSLVRKETIASLAFHKDRWKGVIKSGRAIRSEINAELRKLHQVANSDVALTFELVKQEAKSADQAVKLFGKDMGREITNIRLGNFVEVNSSLERLKAGVQRLSDMGVAFTRKAQKSALADRSYQALQKAQTGIRELEIAIKNAQSFRMKEGMNEVLAEIAGSFHNIRKAVREYGSAQVLAAKQIGRGVAAGKQMSSEVMRALKGKVAEKMSDLAKLDSMMTVESTLYHASRSRIIREAPVLAKKYEKAIKEFHSLDLQQKVIVKFQNEKWKHFDDYAKQTLPSHLHEKAKFMRTFFDGWLERLKEVDPKFQQIESIGYFPRNFEKEFMDEMFPKAYGKPGGTTAGFTKARKMESHEAGRAWAEANSGTKMEDSAVLLGDYHKNAEMYYTKKWAEKKISERLGDDWVTKKENINLKKAMDFILSDGIEPFKNPWLSGAFKVYGKILNVTKFMLTSANPAFWGRNILGYPLLAMTTSGIRDAFNLRNLGDSFLFMTGRAGEVVARNGKRFSYDAIRQEAAKTGYFASSFTRHEITSRPDFLVGRMSNWNPMKHILNFFHYSQKVEDFGRVGAMMANLRSGEKTISEAAMLGRKAMFDYNLINSPADKALQGVFGFYVFSRRNLPRQFATLFNDPKQFNIVSKVIDKISKREELSKDEIEAISHFDRQTFKIFGEAVNGVRRAFSLGFLPVEEAYQTFNAVTNVTKGPRQWMQGVLGSRMNPVVGSFLDYFYEKNSFTQGDFGTYLPERYTRIIPDKVAKLIGLTPGTRPKYEGGKVVGQEKVFYGDPDKIFMITRIPITSRILNDLANLGQNMSTGKTFGGVLRFTTGIRQLEVDPERARAFKAYRRSKIIQKMAEAKGAKTFSRTYIPKKKP